MEHGFLKPLTPKCDEPFGDFSLGPSGRERLIFVSDAPSRAPPKIGTAIRSTVEKIVKNFNQNSAENPDPPTTQWIIAQICSYIHVKLQERNQGNPHPTAVTNIALAATCKTYLFYYLVGDSFLIRLRGREEERPRLLPFSSTKVWNHHQEILYSEDLVLEDPEEIRDQIKYLGVPPFSPPFPGAVPCLEMSPGDWYMVASDGLTAHLNFKDILHIYAQAENPDDFIDQLESTLPFTLKDDVSAALVTPILHAPEDIQELLADSKNEFSKLLFVGN